MKKSKVALFIDSLFLSFIISFLIYLWLNKFYKNAIFVKIISILILLSCFVLFLHLFNKHNNKLIFKNYNEIFLKNCINKLILSPSLEYENFICKLLNCSHIENYLFKLNDKFLYINIKTELSSTDYFSFQETLIKNSIMTNQLYFIYNSKNKSFDDIVSISNFQIELIKSEILIKIMSLKNIFPLEKEQTKTTPLKRKVINNIKSKCNTITTKHFKEFFFSGISLLFLSIIVPFSNYYLISGTILLIISIISLFKKNIDSKINNIDFLFDIKQK